MPTWHTGQAWRVVNCLNILNAQIRGYAPHSVPPATNVDSWGSIADNAHSTSSDHYPHYFAALGSTAVVTARDFPHAPDLGLDGGTVTEHMRQERDNRIQYIIFNRRITGVSYGWEWHTYTGDDPHNTHFHVSSVHDGRADISAPWSLPGSSVTTPEPVNAGSSNVMFMGITNTAPVFLVGPGGIVHVPTNTALQRLLKATNQNVFVASDQAEFDYYAVGIMEPATAAQVDVAAFVAAVNADRSFGDLIESRAYAAAQDAEKS